MAVMGMGGRRDGTGVMHGGTGEKVPMPDRTVVKRVAQAVRPVQART